MHDEPTHASAIETLSIRPFTPDDRMAVLSVFESNTPGFFAVDEAADVTTFLDAADSTRFVATIAPGEVIGFGGAYLREPPEGGLAWGMVRADWHGHGVGSALLAERIAHLRALGCTIIRVQTSQHSVGFFLQAGFRIASAEADGFAPGIDRITLRQTF